MLEIPMMSKLLKKLIELSKLTLHNEAFLLVSDPPTPGDKIGFIKIGDKMYYFSPVDGTKKHDWPQI